MKKIRFFMYNKKIEIIFYKKNKGIQIHNNIVLRFYQNLHLWIFKTPI